MIASYLPPALRPGPALLGLNQQAMIYAPALVVAASVLSQAVPMPSPLIAGTGFFAVTLARSVTSFFNTRHRARPVLNACNRVTGEVEAALAPVRDPLALGASSLSLVLGGSAGLFSESSALLTALISLSLVSVLDRRAAERKLIEAELKQNAPLSPEGWRRQTALGLGAFARPPESPLPQNDLLNPYRLNYSRAEPPTRSVIPNLVCLLVFLRGLSVIRRHSERRAKEFVFQRTLAAVHEANRNRVKVEGLEKLAGLPKDAPVLWSTFPHTNIYFDMGAGLVHSRQRFAADRSNFFDHPAAKALGWRRLVRDLEIPLVVRGGANAQGRKAGGEDPFQTPIANGIQPAIHFQAGRVPPAYDEKGRIDRPGLYANVVDPKDPAKYAKRGIVFAAVEAARRSGQSAFIPLLQIVGAERAQPKFSKIPPFLQQNETEQNIVYRVEGVLEVRADADPDRVWTELLRRAKAAMGIDPYLTRLAAEWTGTEEPAFAALAQKDERLFVIVDRIRCLHPRYAERNAYKCRLAEVLAHPSDERVSELLKDVSKTLKKVEYKR